jgi:hypothetical protein
MKKEKKIHMSVSKMFADRNLKFNEHIVQTFTQELKNETNETLKKLFDKLYTKSYYSDPQKTIQRMPCLLEIKELVKQIKQYTNYITPDEFCLAMPQKEKQEKQAIHVDMTQKIKQFLKNGAKDEELDVIFAKN